MSLALCWAIKTGDWLSSHRPPKVKKHGRQQASVFRYGFDYLRSIFFEIRRLSLLFTIFVLYLVKIF